MMTRMISFCTSPCKIWLFTDNNAVSVDLPIMYKHAGLYGDNFSHSLQSIHTNTYEHILKVSQALFLMLGGHYIEELLDRNFIFTLM